MKIFFQKNSEKEKEFKCYINVKKKTFKRAVDRNKIKRRIRHIVRELIAEKNIELANNFDKFVNKKKIIVMYDFQPEVLTMNFQTLKENVFKLIKKK